MSKVEVAPTRGSLARLKGVRARVRSTRAGRWAWRCGVGVLGVAVIALGIVLLPLPGPGWLIVFAGLAILASEFEWAARLLRYARRKVSDWRNWLAIQGRGAQVLLGVAGLAVLVGVVAAAWWVYSR